jgi:hypothetical protein
MIESSDLRRRVARVALARSSANAVVEVLHLANPDKFTELLRP